MQFPNTAEELLELMDELIPEPTPRPGDTNERIRWDLARRSVVHEIRALRQGRVPTALRQKRGEGRIVPSKNP